MTKKMFAGGKAGKKLFANSLSKKKLCLHGNFKEFANFKISAFNQRCLSVATNRTAFCNLLV